VALGFIEGSGATYEDFMNQEAKLRERNEDPACVAYPEPDEDCSVKYNCVNADGKVWFKDDKASVCQGDTICSKCYDFCANMPVKCMAIQIEFKILLKEFISYINTHDTSMEKYCYSNEKLKCASTRKVGEVVWWKADRNSACRYIHGDWDKAYSLTCHQCYEYCDPSVIATCKQLTKGISEGQKNLKKLNQEKKELTTRFEKAGCVEQDSRCGLQSNDAYSCMNPRQVNGKIWYKADRKAACSDARKIGIDYQCSTCADICNTLPVPGSEKAVTCGNIEAEQKQWRTRMMDLTKKAKDIVPKYDKNHFKDP